LIYVKNCIEKGTRRGTPFPRRRSRKIRRKKLKHMDSRRC